MFWNKARPSDNVNDRRKGKDARTLTGKKLGAGLVTAALAGTVIYSTLTPAPLQHTTEENAFSLSPSVIEDPQLRFIESILGDTEDTWKQLFTQADLHYPPPALTLFDNDIASACGYASASSGPFYCPVDRQIYLAPGFFDQMAHEYSAVGDFAQAFVIAHEVSHHVQLEMGLSAPFETALLARQPVTGDAGLEVRTELQADCLAGVWAHQAQQRLVWLEPGDIDEALNAASVFGDDYLQRAQNLTIRPETFSHGTSPQRSRWFSRGLDSGRVDACDTFNAAQL
ncbi:neutral zinc metallopeptidase [Pseudomonas sp. HS6]|uniref:KPN_02809 family neutral zinc metallopeptidase n=1 Tax=Pseudomonas sp. HS6 TaxID=2850559 RepID=UPI002018E78A|nr:neutral zinc metallopeptidase [Pseudomonas sp. HS6]UQS13927.1 neutral zinc metallopeptidase [Pseudomonas sp. HS6]